MASYRDTYDRGLRDPYSQFDDPYSQFDDPYSQFDDPYDKLNNPAAAPEAPRETAHGSTLGTVLDVLDYFDRPRNIVASSLWNMVDDDPNTTFLGGLWKGAKGEQRTSWGDFLGIDSPNQNDDWGEYLAKGGSRLALDAAFDPLNLLFGTGAVTKALGLSAKGASAFSRIAKLNEIGKWREALAAGELGKSFYKRLPHGIREVGGQAIDYNRVEDVIHQLKMENAMGAIERQADEAAKTVDEIFTRPEFQDYTKRQLFEAIERPGSIPELDEAVQAVMPLKAKNREVFDELRSLQQELTGKKRLAIEDIEGDEWLRPYTHLPRVIKPEEVFLQGLKKSRGPQGLEITPQNAFSNEARNIFEWTPVEGGDSFIRKYNDEVFNTVEGVGDEPTRYFYTKPDGTQIEVKRGQASLMDLESIRKGKKVPKGKTLADAFIDDPIEALKVATARNQGKLTYLKIIKQLTDEGALTKLKKGDEAGEGFRRLRVPGFTGYATTKAAATRLDNVYKIISDPDSHAEGIARILQAVTETTVGRLAAGATEHWKRNVLPLFTGFHAANAISNVNLVYTSGVRDPRIVYESGNILWGDPGKSVIRGWKNGEIKRLLQDAKFLDTRAISHIGETQPRANKIPFLKIATDRMGKIGKPISWTGEQWRKANDLGFAFGGGIEDHAKMMIVVDRLKKLIKKTGRPPTKEEIYKAARESWDFLFDYMGDMTPVENQLRQLFPFYSWTSNITKRTLRDAIERPQKLAQLDRFYNEFTEPFTDEEKEIAPNWMQDQGVVHSIGGGLGGWLGGPDKAIALSRFIPQGTIESFLPFKKFGPDKLDPWKPLAEVFNMLGPIYKGGGELFFNKKVYNNREIDPIGNPLASLITAPFSDDWSPDRHPFFNVKLPAAYQYLWAQSPIGRHSGVASRLLEGTTHNDPGRDPMSPYEKIGYFLTSGRAMKWNPERARNERRLDAKRKASAIKREITRAKNNHDIAGVQFWMKRQKEFEKWRQKAFHAPGP